MVDDGREKKNAFRHGRRIAFQSLAALNRSVGPTPASIYTSGHHLQPNNCIIRCLLNFTGFPWALLVFNGLYLVLLGFIGFYWVLLSFTGFY